MNFAKGHMRICGSNKDVGAAIDILKKCQKLESMAEPEARRCIQALIDEYSLKAAILWNGNTVWSKTRILRDLRRVVKHGMIALSDYLYAFFHLCCGSIAHYNRQGWICEYPDIESVRNFFVRNEYGSSVLAHQPHWAADRIEIIKEINQILKIEGKL